MKYLYLNIVILISLNLFACSPKPVLIPVSSCPTPPVINCPTLAIDGLSKKPETKDALKALMIDHINLKDTRDQCLKALEVYRNEK